MLLRAAYFQVKAESSIAMLSAARTVSGWLQQKAVRRQKDALLERFGDSYGFSEITKVFEPEGGALLEEFKNRYRADFDKLLSVVKKDGAQLIVLYVPSAKQDTLQFKKSHEFFRSLSQSRGIPFIDVSDAWFSHPWEVVTLDPFDSHPSRRGYQLIAKAVSHFVKGELATYRSGLACDVTKARGDLPSGLDRVVEYKAGMPFRLTTNSQGFRIDRELDMDKSRQRVLLLGDSFTYGPYLNAQDTYPGILQRMHPEKDVVNAGMLGYTIQDELALYEEGARYICPDVVVLQVLDNDLYGMFAFQLQQFARDRDDKRYEESESERHFLDWATSTQ